MPSILHPRARRWVYDRVYTFATLVCVRIYLWSNGHGLQAGDGCYLSALISAVGISYPNNPQIQ